MYKFFGGFVLCFVFLLIFLAHSTCIMLTYPGKSRTYHQNHQIPRDLALTVNPADGHLVNYQNADFWSSPAKMGGASFKSEDRYSKDYKNLEAYNAAATRLLIVVHQDNKVKGWRSWNLAKPGNSLGSYFDSSTTPQLYREGKYTDFTAGVRMTSSPNNVSPHDPIIRDNYELFVDVDMDGNIDFSRIAAKPSGDHKQGDMAYGLGGCYDCGYNHAPECDANFVPGVSWGTSGGQPGPMGTDCSSTTCGYCKMSGETYSYSIFVGSDADGGDHHDDGAGGDGGDDSNDDHDDHDGSDSDNDSGSGSSSL